jgi:hypothetical protein
MMVNDSQTRRSLLRNASIGLGLAGFLTLPRGVAAKKQGKGNNTKGKIPLEDGPAEFRVYVAKADGSSGDLDEPVDFNYPRKPSIASEDPKGGIFDASDIVKTPNGKTLHHSLRFFQGFLLTKNHGKPYVLIHEGDGRYTERGQHMNFEARSTDALKRRLSEARVDPSLAEREPLDTLAGNEWRAVGNDVVQFAADPAQSRRIRWSLTRIDFYRRSGGPPQCELSALYVIYPNLDGNGNPTEANPANPTIRPIPGTIGREGRNLINDGRANLGGQ